MAALMPPAAATECERTGWTLLMIATDAPASAAARAARWPARPAPRMRTSCAGMYAALRLEVRGHGLYRSSPFRHPYVRACASARTAAGAPASGRLAYPTTRPARPGARSGSSATPRVPGRAATASSSAPVGRTRTAQSPAAAARTSRGAAVGRDGAAEEPGRGAADLGVGQLVGQRGHQRGAAPRVAQPLAAQVAV